MSTSWTIGSHSDCDLVLSSPVVSGHHCRLIRDSAGILLEDLNSTNGTYFNGQRVRGSTAITLGLGDSIHLGSYLLSGKLVLSLLNGETPAPGPSPPIPGPALAPTQAQIPIPASAPVSGGPRTITISRDDTVLGRGSDCTQVIDLPMVSSRHARIQRSTDGYTIQDLGSSNGTYVNGVRIAGPTVVRSGDLIGLGSALSYLQILPRPADKDPQSGASVPRLEDRLESGTDAGAPVLVTPSILAEVTSGHSTKDKEAPEPEFWRYVLVPAALLFQAPILVALIAAVAGGISPALTLYCCGLAAIWFGLSSAGVFFVGAALGGLIDGRRLRAGLTTGGAPALLGALLLAGLFAVIQTVVAWELVSRLVPLRSSGFPALGLLLLAAATGIAMGLLLSALLTLPGRFWLGLLVSLLLMWLLGGLWPALLRVPVISSLTPQRWVFEGLLIQESGADPRGEPVETYFPADSERMGLFADVLALSFLLVGCAGGFIATSRSPRPRELPAFRVADT